MGRVFVVQELRSRDGEPLHDLSPALAYGDLEVLISHNKIGIAVQPLVAKMRHQLRSFSDDDYILPVGDPVVIGMAVAIAAEMNRGKIKVLRWDKLERNYIKIAFDLKS